MKIGSAKVVIVVVLRAAVGELVSVAMLVMIVVTQQFDAHKVYDGFTLLQERSTEASMLMTNEVPGPVG